MANRFSRITESARLRPALDRYVQYLSGTATRPSRINTRGAVAARRSVWVTPFTFDIDTGEGVKVTTAQDDYTFLSPIITASSRAAVIESAPTTSLEIPGFKAARLIFFMNQTRSVSVATSDVTGLQYLKYAGDRRSSVFGRQTATDDETDAFRDLKARLLTNYASAAVKRVSLSPEKSQYR